MSEQEWQDVLQGCAARIQRTKKWIACCLGPALFGYITLGAHAVADPLRAVPCVMGLTALDLARVCVGLWGWWGFCCCVNLAYIHGWVNHWTQERRSQLGQE